MKNRTLVVILTLIIIALIPFLQTITGQVTTETYARSLDHHITQFFNVNALVFPQGACGDAAFEMYEDLTTEPTDTLAEFQTSSQTRFSTASFVIDRTARFGSLDLVKGITFTGNNLDSFISFNVEAIARVPKDQRNTYYMMDLYGISEDKL